MNDIIIVDDIVPKSYQEKIKRTMFSNRFAWFYIDDVTYGDRKGSPAANHIFVRESEINSPHFDLIDILSHVGAEQVGIPFGRVEAARAFLQYPLSETSRADKVDPLHVDIKQKHLVVLYYVVDSDGDTIIVDKKDTNSLNYEDYEVLHRVTPKQGRAVIFDGSYWHTAEQPKHNMRCVVNINIVKDDHVI
jgi:hypothetical protein